MFGLREKLAMGFLAVSLPFGAREMWLNIQDRPEKLHQQANSDLGESASRGQVANYYNALVLEAFDKKTWGCRS